MAKKEKKKMCVFLASYFLATMTLSSIYLSLGQIQQQKNIRIPVKTVTLKHGKEKLFFLQSTQYWWCG